MYPDDDYEDDLQDELEQDYQDSLAGIRGWDNVEDFYDDGDAVETFDEPLSDILDIDTWDEY